MTGALTGASFVVAVAVAAGVRLVAADRLNRDLPFATFALNVGASFALGVLHHRGGLWAGAVGIGALGVVATWATLANEVAVLARSRQAPLAWLYLAATVTTSILAAWIGLQVAA